MDLDIEMDDAAHEDHPIMEMPVGDDILQPEEPEELGEVIEDDQNTADDESKALAPNKLHIRGLDTLHTDDIKTYVKTYFGPCDKVEWIDDTSANIVFSSDNTARDALVALSTIEIADPSALSIGEILPAKTIQSRPEITLQVRLAVQSDRKHAGAALRSRYYLLHPEHDPEERRRQQQNRNKYRHRDNRRDDRNGRYNRRNSEDDNVPFEASMYDDAPRAARPRRHSTEDDRHDNRGKELFAGHRRGRDRSASPLRDNDGDAAMDRELLPRTTRRRSSSKNRPRARDLKDRISAQKELFPIKSLATLGGGNLDTLERAIGSAHLREEDRPKIVDHVPNSISSAFNIRGTAHKRGNESGGFNIRGTAASAKELFPSKLGGEGNSGKELIGGKRAIRQRAEDLFG